MQDPNSDLDAYVVYACFGRDDDCTLIAVRRSLHEAVTEMESHPYSKAYGGKVVKRTVAYEVVAKLAPHA